MSLVSIFYFLYGWFSTYRALLCLEPVAIKLNVSFWNLVKFFILVQSNISIKKSANVTEFLYKMLLNTLGPRICAPAFCAALKLELVCPSPQVFHEASYLSSPSLVEGQDSGVK